MRGGLPDDVSRHGQPGDAPDAPSQAAIRRIIAADTALAADAELAWEPLNGGVSADLWRVSIVNGAPGTWIVKQPRVRLRVAGAWQVSTERALYEVRYHELLGEIAADAAPEVLAYDPAMRLFVMRDYAPPAFRPWKALLLDGRVDPTVAHALGAVLGRVHARSATRPELAERFATGPLFHALRIRPYLHVTAEAHRDLAPFLKGLEKELMNAPRALVHGDVSPKNVLVGPENRILLLDAECAWWGAPHFDAAFLVHHLMLKWARDPAIAHGALAAIRSFLGAWLTAQARTLDDPLVARMTRLLPALLLARIDGLSPVDYLDEERRGRVRSFARGQLRAAPAEPDLLLRRFERAMGVID
ncbi:MAG TPA: aminoglycoside phosphotransferase family protein [Pseudomonadales bacterium]|nr:aminoglycoside phosphotransferase family protein [Pseudomonadales bacterium]